MSSRTGRRLRRRWRRLTRNQRRAVTAIAVGLLVAVVLHGHKPAAGQSPFTSAPSPAAATAIAYARQQIGKPYVYGATGPYAYDCSGLVMQAYASAGVSIPRTSEKQWAGLPHVSSPQPGDLVFFPGGDGTWTEPGHVALVISATQMIQAYATGTPIEISPLSGAGAGGIVGYARPW